MNIGNFGGGGFTTEDQLDDTPTDWFDTEFICTASGGSGSGLRVRVNLTGVSTGSGVGTISVTTDDIIDSGRDYVLGEKVTLTNTNGPGRIEDVEITKVL